MGFDKASSARALGLRGGSLSSALQTLVEASAANMPRDVLRSAQVYGSKAQVSKSAGEWQWQAQGEGWKNYDAEAAARLTEAYLKFEEECVLVHGHHGTEGGWRIDLEELHQTRLDNPGGRRRAVRGKVVGETVLPLSQRCRPPDEDEEEPQPSVIRGSSHGVLVLPAAGEERPVERADCAAPLAVWEWYDDEDERWISYPLAAHRLLNDAHAARKGEVTITAENGAEYQVLLQDMAQVSLKRNSRREVRRTEAAQPGVPTTATARRAAASGGQVEWQHLGRGSLWESFDRATSSKIEDAFSALQPGVDVQIGGVGPAYVDFDPLEYIPSGSSGARVMVRRVPPEKCGFQMAESEREVSQRLRDTKKPFVDDAFQGSDALFRAGEVNSAGTCLVAQWLRPQEVQGLGKEKGVGVQLKMMCQDVLPRDVAQGGIGNCWIVSVLALLATRADLIRKLLVTSDVSKDGAYIVRLCHAGSWRYVLIDDLLPCRRDGSLMYTSARRHQLWAPLIEKAFAKLHGSYESLIGGRMYEAMGVLTGYMCDLVQLDQMPNEAAWFYVQSMLEQGFFLCSGTRSNVDAAEAKSLGLQTGHAYSLLTAHESKRSDGSILRLLELRNPHGRGVWKGDWSDLSPMWNSSHAPRLKHDGVRQKPPTARFWMSFEDFLKWFGAVQYCKVRDDAEWGDERLEVPLAPPGVLGSCSRALRFTAHERTQVELAMLQAGSRGRGAAIGVVDLGFSLLRLAGPSDVGPCLTLGGERFKALGDGGEGECERQLKSCVSLEAYLDPGEYVLVPNVVAGRRAARPGSHQDHGTLVLHSKPHVKQALPVDGLSAGEVLRDLLLLRSQSVEGRQNPDLCTGEGGEIFFIKEPAGVTCVAVNRSEKFPLKITLHADSSKRVEASRGSLKTEDLLLPGQAQVIQVLTYSPQHGGAKELRWSTRVKAQPPGTPEFHEPHTDEQPLHSTVLAGPKACDFLTKASPQQLQARGVTEKMRVEFQSGATLVVSRGSVIDFGGGTDWAPGVVAAVNAANEGGLGGSGVDGAFVDAGGPLLAQHRKELPLLPGSRSSRIKTGSAVATGPAQYGRLHAGTVIHAVGPNYGVALGMGASLEDCDHLLASAYAVAIDVARQRGIQFLGFSLLSAGVFRGPRTLKEILQIAVDSVAQNGYEGLKEVHLVAFQAEELSVLVECAEALKRRKGS